MNEGPYRGYMSQAILRFYAELVDFVGDSRRETTRTFDVPGSVKDLIESSGVPHTEVDLVLVNGESVDLSHRIQHGDRVSVYPVFEAFDVGDVTRVRSRPLRVTRFVLDVHLGRLARYLRLLGFDTDYATERDDPDLVEISVDEKRILLTRDVELLKHSDVTHGAYVRSTDPSQQLVEIVRRFQLRDSIRPFSRCMACNGVLREGVTDPERVPPDVRRQHDRFSSCPNCERVFWRGGHATKLDELVEVAREA